jgi:hypothetical protein
MKKKLQVFISSTYTDMLAERQAAVEAILRAGHIPAGMELFAAGDESQLEIIHRWIEDSDVFMLILGGRYGSIEPKEGKSYIELEYDYASQLGKPMFAAVISESYLDTKVKDNGRSVVEKSNGNLLESFRRKVTAKICRFFSDVNELKLIVFESLSNFERNDGLAGWIHGSDVVDPKAILEEVNRLQAENVLLSNELSELRATIPANSQQKAISSLLSNDAKELLLSGKKSDGRIQYWEYDAFRSGLSANRVFIDDEGSTPREKAFWKAAFKELLAQQVIEPLDKRYFLLTKLGYEVCDEIEVTSTEISD